METKRHVEVQRLFRTAYLVAKDGLSFRQYSRLCELQCLNGLDVGENYLSHNSCSSFIASIADDIKNTLRSEVQGSCFVSVLSDGSTDKG